MDPIITITSFTAYHRCMSAEGEQVEIETQATQIARLAAGPPQR